ncbi:MAG: DUF1207 domain-containing protein [Deltaproteobacteria bacterium]|nr:DUF1207 domain-containing protein [Deltaproteobacteria bacterium]
MKLLILTLLIFMDCVAFPAVGLELIPKGRPFRLTFADPREIRMAITFDGTSKINASIGNYFSILGIRNENNPDWFFHLGLEGAGYFTMRQSEKRFPLETADGLFGFYIETSVGSCQYQFRLTHISAHLADGSNDGAFPFSRETAILRFGYLLNPDVHLYSGLQYIFNTTPLVARWSLQLGGTGFIPISESKIVPFGAFDLKQKGDAPHNPSVSLQLGVAFGNPPDLYKSFRFFYAYFSGVDPRGQYFTRQIMSHSLGIEMQI